MYQELNFNCPHCGADQTHKFAPEVFDLMIRLAIQVSCPECKRGVWLERKEGQKVRN